MSAGEISESKEVAAVADGKGKLHLTESLILCRAADNELMELSGKVMLTLDAERLVAKKPDDPKMTPQDFVQWSNTQWETVGVPLVLVPYNVVPSILLAFLTPEHCGDQSTGCWLQGNTHGFSAAIEIVLPTSGHHISAGKSETTTHLLLGAILNKPHSKVVAASSLKTYPKCLYCERQTAHLQRELSEERSGSSSAQQILAAFPEWAVVFLVLGDAVVAAESHGKVAASSARTMSSWARLSSTCGADGFPWVNARYRPERYDPPPLPSQDNSLGVPSESHWHEDWSTADIQQAAEEHVMLSWSNSKPVKDLPIFERSEGVYLYDQTRGH
eukprot:Skav234609  [mRNA]  locus=scaffold1110:324648:331434:- [translate_table: standard]